MSAHVFCNFFLYEKTNYEMEPGRAGDGQDLDERYAFLVSGCFGRFSEVLVVEFSNKPSSMMQGQMLPVT